MVLPAASMASALTLFRVRNVAVVDLCDLPVLHQHRAVLDHLPVADEDARIADQQVRERDIRGPESSSCGRCPSRAPATCRARRTAAAPPAPRASPPGASSLPSPSERASRRATARRTWSAPAPRPPASSAPAIPAAQNPLKAGHEIGGGNELRHSLQPVREHATGKVAPLRNSIVM